MADTESIDKFWVKAKRCASGCWLWTGGVHACGYGYHRFTGESQQYAHRIAYRIAHGEIPEGLCVLHKCDNPVCVNPEHLHVGTRAQNNAEAKARGRNAKGLTHGTKTQPGCMPRGEKHWNAKYNDELIRRIRLMVKTSNSYAVARKLSIPYGSIRNIVKRKIWKHI